MPTLDDVSRLALALPGTTEGLGRAGKPWLSWYIDGRCFAWERTFSKADLRRFADDRVPSDPILAMATADLEDKEAVLAEGRRGVFSIPHLDGYPALLVELSRVGPRVLARLVEDAWLAKAPAARLAEHRGGATRWPH
jgi:hypothetical protein